MVVGGALLALLSSLAGVFIYTSFFETPTYFYLPQETFPSSFSKYTDDSVPQQPSVKQEGPDFIYAAELARPAVVHIKSRYEARRQGKERDFFSNPFRDFFDEDMLDVPQGMASGSGVLISPDGYVATNNHVIQDADEVEVVLFDNRSFKAKIIGTDVSTDLALLKIEEDALPHLKFGDSDDVRVGQWVMAVGNPMDLTSTVTAGIVSAKGRNINLLRADSEFAIESFIQTDAAVNKGNSGGALVDINGKLIGINTAIASRTGFYSGYSFAIPASIARKVMEDLLTYGEVRRGYLGVSIQPVDADLARRNNLDVMKGAYVSDVNEDLGASEAGIRKGDVIVSVNGIEINNSSELQEQVSRYRPGDKVRVLAFRGAKQIEFNVPLKPLGGSIQVASNTRGATEIKGSSFRLLSAEEYRRLDISNGVMVEEAGEKMTKGGIQDGFVITEIDGIEIQSIEDLEEALNKSDEYITMKGLYNKGMIASYSFSW
ncbi:MAG: Do family serine endopeptidase [Bacteroidetes bacterium]|nr:Do family serine endopeptidase [Bacteroidota bacterium]MCB0842744.1 Do family serine endopeptidase [Bacteroidota bacterium]MCB0852708.1 Do family serine endopeptidase [Bacteroidota bacterium]